MKQERDNARRGAVERGRTTPEPRLEQEVLDALACPVGAPDLTRSIMGRLGYMKATTRASRRARVRTVARRSSVCLAAFAAIGIGIKVYHEGPSFRAPSGPTISEVIGNDVKGSRDRLRGSMRLIRNLAVPNLAVPKPAPPANPEGIDADVDRSAVGPVRWL